MPESYMLFLLTTVYVFLALYRNLSIIWCTGFNIHRSAPGNVPSFNEAYRNDILSLSYSLSNLLHAHAFIVWVSYFHLHANLLNFSVFLIVLAHILWVSFLIIQGKHSINTCYEFVLFISHFLLHSKLQFWLIPYAFAAVLCLILFPNFL